MQVRTGLGHSLSRFSLFSVILLLMTVSGLPPVAALAAERGIVIEDFESGSVTLDSYPDQDQDPDSWSLITNNTHEGDYALRINGNSWKTMGIAPYTITGETVWQVAVYVDNIGEMQGFGIGDGVNELIYTMAGDDLPEGPEWWTVYQGAYGTGHWRVYLLPIGEDWFATHAYLPNIDKLIFVNDCDSGNGTTIFDTIIDVTTDLPVPPEITVSRNIRSMDKIATDRYRAEVQFYADVVDPDSETHTFHWDFGDDQTSSEQNPTHDFIVEANYPYTVSCVVHDPDNQADSDTLQVSVETGVDNSPLIVNFVGDIMTGRGYENHGGIIDTYGIDALYTPTKGIFGDAADLSMANLEVSYTDGGTPHPTKSVVFRARPENFIGVVNAGIDLVTLGNNHIIDYGEVGMLQTIALCDQYGIGHDGAGINDYFAMLPSYRTERGVRLAFLGFSNRTGRRWNSQPFLDAGASKCGFAYNLPKNLESAIGDTRSQADIVIVQTHTGNEYMTSPPDEDEPGGAKIIAGGVHKHLTIEHVADNGDVLPENEDFLFRHEPLPTERALRRLALDLGADVLINHHPHVVQGFESYNGKLIAHSMGNFIFELPYIETMSTMVLSLEIDKTGITGYTFKPAWIDDYITQPATGQFGRELIDRLADYSRPMGAVVAYDADNNLGRIHLSYDDAQASTEQYDLTVPCRQEGDYQLSKPIPVTGPGNLSRIIAVNGENLGDYEISFGREVLWHGTFEDEGATLWDDNTSDEWLDDTVSYKGERSLALRRSSSAGTFVGTDQERHPPCVPTKRHSFSGWLKADNTNGANMLARFYSSRSASSYITSTQLGPAFEGTSDWFHQWAELETPEEATYFEVRCTMDPPDSGEGMSWFDEIKFIEWDEWQTGAPDLAVASPNNYRFIQIRSNDPAVAEITVSYEETAYVHLLTQVPGQTVEVPSGRISQNFPNPFNPSTNIELTAPAGNPVKVSLEIYDVKGRLVNTLFNGTLQGNERRTFIWDGTDADGERQASGVYFSRARFASRTESRKMIMLK
ncbi:MAG: T9SS type A sorting domain-containing protein [bacterium]|nr:T9SS type A sorting domain-containing protein [bacterium]